MSNTKTAKALADYVNKCKHRIVKREQWCSCGVSEGYKSISSPIEPTLKGFAIYLETGRLEEVK